MVMPTDDTPYEDRPEIAAEADDAGCEAVPADLVELHEVLEWQAAVDELEAAEVARGIGPDLEHQDEPDPYLEGRQAADVDLPDDEPDIGDTQTGQGVE